MAWVACACTLATIACIEGDLCIHNGNQLLPLLPVTRRTFEHHQQLPTDFGASRSEMRKARSYEGGWPVMTSVNAKHMLLT